MSDYDPAHDIDATRADESPQSKPKPVDPENTPSDAVEAAHVLNAPPVPPEPGGRPPGVDELLAEGVVPVAPDPVPEEPDPAPELEHETHHRRRRARADEE